MHSPVKPIRIRAGAHEPLIDPSGLRWEPDGGYRGGEACVWPDTRVASSRHAWRYRTSREGAAGYAFDLPDGRYDVLLYFIELDPSVQAAGTRVFEVTVCGREFPGIDIWNLTTGRMVPYTIATPATVTGGRLTISFSATKGRSTVSAIEINPCAAPEPRSPVDGPQLIEDFSRFDGDGGALAAVVERNEVHNRAAVGLERDALVKGLAAMRVDYGIDTTLTYGDQVFLTCRVAADLAGRSSVSFLIKPDGSNRRAALILHNGKGQMGACVFDLTGTQPRVITCSLKNMGTPWWPFNAPEQPSFDGPVTAVSIRIWFTQTGELGQGTVLLGPVAAGNETVAPVLAPPSPDRRTIGNILHIENFDSYATDEQLRERYGWTMHGGMISIGLDRTHVCDGPNSMRMDYYFGKRSYAGWVMFPTLDLRQYNALRFWVKPDGSGNMLKIFFAIGGRYEWRGEQLYGAMPRIVEVPFRDFLGHFADLNQTIEIAFWVERVGNSEGGTIWLDQIEAVRNPNFGLDLAPLPDPYLLPGDRITRIDCGAGVDTIDGEGNTWLSDRGFWWGNPSSYPASRDYGGDPQAAILRTERFGLEGYGFGVPDGEYELRLHFAESWDGACVPGRRVFGLRVNGEKQKDVDIFAEAGALYRHVIRRIPVTVTDGKIELIFDPVANHPKIDGIEIVPASLARR